LIFTFLYAGRSTETASERLVWCIHIYFVNFAVRPTPKPRDPHTRVAKCIEVDGGIFEHLL